MYTKRVSKGRKKLLKSLAITRRVLLLIAEGLREAWNAGSSPWMYQRVRGRDKEEERFWLAARAKRALKDLERRKFIATRKEGEKVLYALTDKGRTAVLKELIRSAEPLRDGRYCLIAFDIPEQERIVRDQLRRVLRDCGFRMVQQSVWISDRAVAAQTAEFVKEMGAERWVHLYEAAPIIPKSQAKKQ